MTVQWVSHISIEFLLYSIFWVSWYTAGVAEVAQSQVAVPAFIAHHSLKVVHTPIHWVCRISHVMISYRWYNTVSTLLFFALIERFNERYIISCSCSDFPEFYTKLYALLKPGIFHVKYKARFFYLLDLFLTSTWVDFAVLWVLTLLYWNKFTCFSFNVFLCYLQARRI